MQGLDLRLLIHTHHQGILGRAHVQAHDVADLIDELRVRGQHPRPVEPRSPGPPAGPPLSPEPRNKTTNGPTARTNPPTST